ncbi:MAG: hypothetical protein AABX14_03685 [Candidatus Aenigmatarchaeota archaeon]
MKGQWFIISAVVVSSVLLGISLMLKDYFVVDSSLPVRTTDVFYFKSVNEQLDNIIRNTVTDDHPTCINLSTNLNELNATTSNMLASRGIFFYLKYNIKGCDTTNDVDVDFLVASQNSIIYNFTTLSSPSQILAP